MRLATDAIPRRGYGFLPGESRAMNYADRRPLRARRQDHHIHAITKDVVERITRPST